MNKTILAALCCVSLSAGLARADQHLTVDHLTIGGTTVSGVGTTAGTLASGDNGGRNFSPALAYSPVAFGYHRMQNDLQFSYWDPNYPTANNANVVRIRPTNGGSPAASNGLIDNTLAAPSFWQMENLENVMFEDWKTSGSPVVKAKLIAQWAYVQTVYSAAVLSGDGTGTTINISDDAAWVAQYLAHVHEVTGDPNALKFLGEMIAATTQRFKDPNQTAANGMLNDYGYSVGGVRFTNGKYGMLYAAASDTSSLNAYGYTSTSYEAMLANAAFYYYAQTGFSTYRGFAADTYNWIKQDLSTPAPADSTKKAQYLIEAALDLDPLAHSDVPNAYNHTGGANPYYLQPQHAYFGKPIRSIDSTYIAGAEAEAVLGARLYADGGNAAYLTDMANITGALVSAQGYLRTFNGVPVFANSRDPWTDGFWAPAFAREVLSLAGVDTAGTAKAMFVNTALAIFATCRTSAGRYTADWNGPETEFIHGTASWQAAYDATPGVQAGWQQITTNAATASMAQAGSVVDAWAHRR